MILSENGFGLRFGLEFVALIGNVGLEREQLWATIWARLWKSDVRDNEMTNKGLTLTGERCPFAAIDLSSGRACLGHYLGSCMGAGVGGKK